MSVQIVWTWAVCMLQPSWPNSSVHLMCSLMSSSLTDGLMRAKAYMKSSKPTGGHLSKFGVISINPMSWPSGSEGNVGVHPPSAVYLNLLAVWHLLTGIMRASFTTIAQSDPEYPSASLPSVTQSSSDKLFFVFYPLFLKIPARAVASGSEI